MKRLIRLRNAIAVGFASLILVASPDIAGTRLLADPTLSVTDGGTANGNQLWLVEIAPDPNLFSDTPDGFGGSVAVELDFEITDSEIVAITKNEADWPNDNSGLNPFISDISRGVTMDATTAFISLGSDLFTTADPVEVVTIETLGAGLGTLRWGGRVATPPVGDPYDTARIAQAGTKFDGYQGSLALTALLAGDYSGNGLVEQADLDLVLGNWGADADSVPATWVNDPPVGFVDQAELDKVLGNWGSMAPGLATASAVPEPATWMILFCCLAPLVLRYGHRAAIPRRWLQ